MKKQTNKQKNINISIENPDESVSKKKLDPLMLCDCCLLGSARFICAAASDRSILYALNLLALHSDVLQSALL